MDSKIIDTLVKLGIITSIGIDASKYESVDDLINKGIITIPGIKDRITELLQDIEEFVESEPVVEVTNENIVEIKPEEIVKSAGSELIKDEVITTHTEPVIVEDIKINESETKETVPTKKKKQTNKIED